MSASPACHGLRLDPETRRKARQRLLSVKGHVDAVLRMLDDESVYCVDALKQVKAVAGAMDKVGDMILQSHLKDHVATAAERGDTEAIIAELMEILKYR